MTNKEHRAKVESVFQEIESLLVEATPKQKKAFSIIKGVVYTSFNLIDNLSENPKQVLEQLELDLELLRAKMILQFNPSFKHGGIVQSVESQQGEYIFPQPNPKHQEKPNPPSPKDYNEDLKEWENSFNCGYCGIEGTHKDFTYQRTVANGEVWECRNCNKETLVAEKQNEDDYFY